MMNTGRRIAATAIGTIQHWNFRRMEECATLLRWLAAGSGEQVLDIGCGDGYYDEVIARSGARVTGIDRDRRKLNQARARMARAGLDFHEMDAHDLIFPDASFDKVVSFCVVEHLADDERVLRNVARVLKAGGRLFISVDSLSNPAIRAMERERHRKRYAVRNYYTIEALRDKLARAGFEVEDWRYLLSSPHDLALVRISWMLDRLPVLLAPVRWLGYLMIAGISLAASRYCERSKDQVSGGLTLLARARKRCVASETPFLTDSGAVATMPPP